MSALVTFEAVDVSYHGESQWYVCMDGVCIAEMHRDTPSRWHANGVSGLVVDRQAPKSWSAYYYNHEGAAALNSINNVEICAIPDGATAHEAKRLVRASIQSPQEIEP